MWYIKYNRTGLTVTLRWRIQKKIYIYDYDSVLNASKNVCHHNSQKLFTLSVSRQVASQINSLKHSRSLVQLTLTWGGPRAWRGASSVIVAWGPTWGASWRPAVVGPKPARSSTKTIPRSSLMVSRTIVIMVIIVSIATAVYEKKKIRMAHYTSNHGDLRKDCDGLYSNDKNVVYIIVTHNVNMTANNNTFLDGDFYHHRYHLVVNQSQPLSTLFLFSLLLSLLLSYR